MLTVANGMNLYVIISADIQSSTNVLVGHNYEAEAMENHFEAFFFFLLLLSPPWNGFGWPKLL